MEFDFDTNGLEDATEELNDSAPQVEALRGDVHLRADDLLTPEFLEACSSLSSFDELLKASPFEVMSMADFEAIPDDAWDEFIAKSTTYCGWEEMLGAAAQAWAKRQLGP